MLVHHTWGQWGFLSGDVFFLNVVNKKPKQWGSKRTCKLRNEQESGIFGIRRFTETNAGSIRVFFVHNLVQLKFLSNTGNLGSVSMLKHCLWVWYLEHFWRDWDKKKHRLVYLRAGLQFETNRRMDNFMRKRNGDIGGGFRDVAFSC